MTGAFGTVSTRSRSRLSHGPVHFPGLQASPDVSMPVWAASVGGRGPNNAARPARTEVKTDRQRKNAALGSPIRSADGLRISLLHFDRLMRESNRNDQERLSSCSERPRVWVARRCVVADTCRDVPDIFRKDEHQVRHRPQRRRAAEPPIGLDGRRQRRSRGGRQPPQGLRRRGHESMVDGRSAPALPRSRPSSPGSEPLHMGTGQLQTGRMTPPA